MQIVFIRKYTICEIIQNKKYQELYGKTLKALKTVLFEVNIEVVFSSKH